MTQEQLGNFIPLSAVALFAVRTAAIHWELSLPRWLTANSPYRGVQQ